MGDQRRSSGLPFVRHFRHVVRASGANLQPSALSAFLCREASRVLLSAEACVHLGRSWQDHAMLDTALLVSALTGATAILASWVGSRGSTRAAQIQAQASRAAQEAESMRISRRAAYSEVIHRAHVVGERFIDVLPAVSLSDPTARASALREVLQRHAQLHGEMMRAVHTAHMEGPDDVARAADRLAKASMQVYLAVRAMADEAAAHSPDFDEGYFEFWGAYSDFTSAARRSIHHTQSVQQQPPQGS